MCSIFSTFSVWNLSCDFCFPNGTPSEVGRWQSLNSGAVTVWCIGMRWLGCETRATFWLILRCDHCAFLKHVAQLFLVRNLFAACKASLRFLANFWDLVWTSHLSAKTSEVGRCLFEKVISESHTSTVYPNIHDMKFKRVAYSSISFDMFLIYPWYGTNQRGHLDRNVHWQGGLHNLSDL